MDSGEAVFGVEESLVDRQGRDRVLLTTKAPVCDGQGAVDQIVTVSLDITERKRVEQEIRESEERFRSLVEGSVSASSSNATACLSSQIGLTLTSSDTRIRWKSSV